VVVDEEPNQEDFGDPDVLDDENQDLDELEDGALGLDRIIKAYMTAAIIIADTIITDALEAKASPRYDARYSFVKRLKWIYKV
jgi:hypothetical protein